jgi:DNA replication protein DnaC
MSETIKPQLTQVLRQLRLPAFVENYGPHAVLAANEGMSYEKYLLSLSQLELTQRRNRKVQRLLHDSHLPLEKTFSTFDRSRLPLPVARRLEVLLEQDFLANHENVLAFGNPGSGKTHLLCAVAHELVHKGKAVLFSTCSLLVQRLLRAKAELRLEKELKRLDKFDALIIDDIGYLQHGQDEMEALFTLLAHRYEYRSVMITSNLPFSKWEKIFKDPMTTAAAIDRLVHHSVILELNLPSFRMAVAQKSKKK